MQRKLSGVEARGARPIPSPTLTRGFEGSTTREVWRGPRSSMEPHEASGLETENKGVLALLRGADVESSLFLSNIGRTLIWR